MKIKSVDVIPLQIPFEDGSAGTGLMPTKWTTLEIVLVRIETEDGIVGWGDGFAYSCLRATMAAIEDMVAPLLIGREIAIKAGRQGAGLETKLATDVNCNWSIEQTHEIMPHMRRLDLYWVEEPVFPPDDAETLGMLQAEYGVAIASGENACTSVEFARTAPHIKYLQPSVTKVGGVSEFLRVCDVAEEYGASVMPHAPYFGPGYWATIQLMAAREICEQFEHLYIEPEAYLDPSIPLPSNGTVQVPDRPGIGFEPDPEMIERFRI